MKSLVVVDKADKSVICTAFANGKCHDFNLYKRAKIRANPEIAVKTDTGFIGITKIHANSVLPRKRSKNKPLTKEDKKNNRQISSDRVANEHAIGFVKRFKILAERYRNRRKRFGLRFNLIAGMCNFDRKI